VSRSNTHALVGVFRRFPMLLGRVALPRLGLRHAMRLPCLRAPPVRHSRLFATSLDCPAFATRVSTARPAGLLVSLTATAMGASIATVALRQPDLAACEANLTEDERAANQRIAAQAFDSYVGPGWRRILRMIRRLFALMLLYSPLVIGVPMAITIGRVIPAIETWCWAYALKAVHIAGPAYIKLAQWASSRNDLFPRRFCQTFEQLHDNVPPHPWKDTERILSREAGPDWRDKIRLDDRVIGSGCIAQVYRGWVIAPDSGKEEEVAVKVIHPGVDALVAVDIDIMRTAAQMLSTIPTLKWLSLPDVVEDFALQMFWQLNLRREAENLQRLHHNFINDAAIVIPEPYLDLCTRDLLVETFQPGVPITAFMESPECDDAAKQELSRLGMNSMAKMIFMDNFVHCDLHPGNILIAGKESGKLRMVFLDAGIVKELRPDTHRVMLNILQAFLNWDGVEAGKLMVENADEQYCGDVTGFCNGIQGIIDDSKYLPFFQHFAEYTARIFDLACTYKVKLEGNFITIALAMKVCEGISIRLDPNIAMVQGCVPWLFKAQLRHGVNISDYLWDTHGISRAMLKNLTIS